jgi:LTXXQ motif family protein
MYLEGAVMNRVTVLTAVVLMAASSTAAAQATKGSAAKGKGREPSHSTLLTRYSPYELLIYASVREELKLTPEQEAQRKEGQGKLDRFSQDSMKAFQELPKEGDEPAPEALKAHRDERYQVRIRLEKETDAAMLKSLDPGQRTRLDQIGIQREGPRAFRRPEIQARLNMDPGQIEMINEIVMQGSAAASEVSRVSPDLKQKALTNIPGTNVFKIDPKYADEYRSAEEKGRKAAANVRASTERQVAKLLRPKQRQAYQSLCGEPFDLTTMRLHPPPKPKKEAKAP